MAKPYSVVARTSVIALALGVVGLFVAWREGRLPSASAHHSAEELEAFRGGGSGPEILADADAAAVPPRAPGDRDNLVGTSEGAAFPHVVFERISADAVSKMVRAGLAAIVDDSGGVGRVNGVPLQLRTRELQLRELSNVVLPSDLRPPERLHLTASGVANIQELASNSPATPSGGPLVVYFDEERICFSVRAIRQRN